jgi:hypothetical protein
MKRIDSPFSSAALVLVCAMATATLARADEQAAVSGCIDKIRQVGGPDAKAGGEVLSKDWSQAGTIVRLRDAGGTVWECIGYDDGTVGDLRVVDAMAGAAAPGPVTVHFQPGTSGATYDGTLGPGDAIQYVLGAKKNQFLSVRVAPDGAEMDYQIINPDNSRLLDMIGSSKPYEGQLWQSGNHVVEIVNRTSQPEYYQVEFSIR